jgi:hypothetical protein
MRPVGRASAVTPRRMTQQSQQHQGHLVTGGIIARGGGCWAAETDPNLPLGSGKGPELALRTGSRLAGRELSLRCLLGAQVPSQAQPPVQPVPRSSPSRRTGSEAAGCPSLRPDAVRGGQPSPASQPRAELWGEIYRASKRCQPSKSLLYVCIVPPDRRKSPKVITERSQMQDREQQPSQWRWPRPEAPRAQPRPTARAPDRPGRPRWPRR